MRRGEIYYANLAPTIGDESQKTRPVLIVSCDANNKMANTITIIPITSNTSKVYPFEVFLPSYLSRLPKDSKVQCHQIRTISKSRISSKIPDGFIAGKLLIDVENALKTHLSL